MFKFKPDSKRENEALFGDKDDFEAAFKKNSNSLKEFMSKK